MALCVITLVVTGLLLDSPPESIIPINLLRKVHTLFGFVLIFNTLGQFYYYAVTRRFTEVIFLPRDVVNLRSFLRYMLFAKDALPNYGRYNPGQKLTFTVWWLIIIAASVVSMASVFPSETIWLQRLVGGLGNVRIFKYVITLFFVATIVLHVYLALTEDLAKLQAMITGYINKEIKVRSQHKP
jgi:Ni/Fe-hydrogenase 1 B-type cytochrome subunit